MLSATSHRPQLDTLRFLAFVGVFFFHISDKRYPQGELGVPLFFVLSGFLITRLLLLHQSGNPGHDLRIFYLRRTLRIFPLYYAVLLGLYLLGRLEEPVWYFLYLHNVWIFITHGWTGPTNHFWSLCVEEQFYLLYPLLLLLTPPRARGGLLLGLLAGSIATRLLLGWLYPWSRAWALLPVAGEYLLWGCLAGMADLRRDYRLPPASGLVAAGLGLYALATFDEFYLRFLAGPGLRSEKVYQSIYGAGFALLVLGLWRLPPGWLRTLLCLAPLVYLGRISYGLYVFHNFTYGIKGRLAERLPWLEPVPGPAVAFVATVVLAMLSWHLFEGPINQLKERFPYGRAPRVLPVVEETDPQPHVGLENPVHPG